MGRILKTRTGRTIWSPGQKPPYGARLNPYHPLSQGLVGAWLLNEGGGNTVYDLSTLTQGAMSSGQSWVNNNLYNSNDVQKITIPYNSIQNPTTMTWVIRLIITDLSLSTWKSIVARKNGGFGLFIYSNTNIVIDDRSGTNQAWFGQSPSLNEVITIGAEWSTSLKLYYNGNYKGSQGSVYGGYSDTSEMYICGAVVFPSFPSYNICYYLYNRVVTAEEHASLHTNPYQMFEWPLYDLIEMEEQPAQATPAPRIYDLKPKRNPEQKPPYGARVNPFHPLSQGLVLAFLMNEGGGSNIYDIVNHSVGDGTLGPGGAISWDKNAVYFSGNKNIQVPSQSIQQPSAMTVFARVMSYDLSSIQQIVSHGGNSGYRYRINDDSTVQFLDRGATNILTTTETIAVNTINDLAINGDANGLKIFINGNLSKSNAVAYGGYAFSDTFYIGSVYASELLKGWMYCLYLYNRTLSNLEHASLSANPYQMFWHPVWDLLGAEEIAAMMVPPGLFFSQPRGVF